MNDGECMYLIAIAGGSGSGKTTYAKKISKLVTESDIGIMHMDSYYLPVPMPENKTRSGRDNFDCPHAFDWELLKEHLLQLKQNQTIEIPVYDFKTSRRTQQVTSFSPPKILILEGIFTLYDQAIRDLCQVKVFLHVDSDIRFTRRLKRDITERGGDLKNSIDQYYDSVRPMYQKHLAPQKDFADFIVGEETDVAANILSSHITHHLLYSSLQSTLNQDFQESYIL